MNYNNQYQQDTPGVVRYSCCIIFFTFSFCYLFFIEGETLAQAQYVYSHGITHYSNLVGSLLIPVVLQLFQWLVDRLTRLPSRFHALSYFPSILVLAALTDISQQHLSDTPFKTWNWLGPLLFFLYLLIIVVLKRTPIYEKQTLPTSSRLWPNYLQLFVMMFFCIFVNSTDDVYLYELKAERLILEGQYQQAAEVGINAEATSARLTSLRLFARSQSGDGQLPEHIFLYPQPYGAEGLLVLSDTAKSRKRLTFTDIIARLGAHTEALSMPVPRFLEKLLHLQQAHLYTLIQLDSLTYAVFPDSLQRQHHLAVKALRRQIRTTADYHLCALLLEKNLTQFINELPTYYPQVHDSLDAVRATLPLAYREALAIIAPECCDSLTLQRFDAYTAMRDTLATPRSRRNLTLYKHGRNYWWYCDFQ